MKRYRTSRSSLLSFVSSVIVILSLLLSLASPDQSAFAQRGGDGGIKRQVNAKSGRVSFVGPESGRSLEAVKALGTAVRPQDPGMAIAKRFGSEFGLKNPEQELSEVKTHQGGDGQLTVRYQQKYQGIPVMGGELIVNTNDNGDLYSMNGEISPDLSLGTQPTIDSAYARGAALNSIAQSYQRDVSDLVATEPELWIFDESLLQPSSRPAELVWRMDVTVKDNSMPVRELVLVNAQRGDISLHFNQIDTAWNSSHVSIKIKVADDVTPTATPVPAEPPDPLDTPTPPAVNEASVTDASAVAFVLAPVVNTYTANNSSSLPGSFLCNQNQQPCTVGGANPQADGAHKFAIGTYNFYATQFNRDSIDNNGLTIKSTVQYCEPGFPCPYDNAYWNGNQMVYGSAHDYPLADDVVAHELTHGVTQYESDLFYYYQSGAINESLSDVFGEYYDQVGNVTAADTAGVKWQLGEDVSGLGAIRSMSDPTLFGDPDKMSSPNYFTGGDDNGGIHENSGVNNKAVYLMVDGGNFNGKTVTALGWDKIGAIYYEVNSNLLTSASDYSDLYYAVQHACTNLIGQHGITAANCVQVKNALDAVEMNFRQRTVGNFDDPSFELSYATYPYWDQSSTNFGTPLCTAADCGNSAGTAGSRTGSVWGWFGGTTANETASLLQTVYFPRGYPTIRLKFYLWIGRANAGSDANDKFMAQVDGVTVFTANATQKSSYSSYRQVIVDVSAFARNALHTITFKSVTSGQVVNFNLDDVSLGDDNLAISGNAGIANATLQYVDNGPKTVVADGSGNYLISLPFNWSGTVTPYKSGYTFTPASRSYSNVQSSQVNQDYTALVCGSCAEINVKIGVDSQGDYSLPSGQSMVQSYSGLRGGPVVVKSSNGAPIIASMLELRRSNITVNQWTGIAQVMGMQLENLSDKYVFPRYTNIDTTKYEVIPIANYETFDTNVTVKVGNTIYGPYPVPAGTSYTFNQAVAGGPVLVSSDNAARIVASLYQLKRAGTSGRWNGQSEMMGVPQAKLSDTYVLPYYDYTTPGLLPSLNIANADSIATDITVSIGTSFSITYPAVGAGTSRVVSYSGKAGGPVVVKSSNGAKIIASMLELRRSNITVNQWTGIAQVMGMQLENLSDQYVFPRYTNIDATKYEIIPIANYETFDTNVTIKVGNTDYGPYPVPAGTSYIFNQAIEGGPVLVSSDNAARIVASLYQLKRAGTTGRWNGQSEMMGIPFTQLSSTYVLPYYDYTTPGLLPSLNIAAP